MFYAYCILTYPFHVSGKSTRNKRKKINIEIDKEEDEDLMGIKADETINKGIFFLFECFNKKECIFQKNHTGHRKKRYMYSWHNHFVRFMFYF